MNTLEQSISIATYVDGNGKLDQSMTFSAKASLSKASSSGH